jgi:hypothetical protein
MSDSALSSRRQRNATSLPLEQLSERADQTAGGWLA